MLYCGVDIGTTNVKAIMIDDQGEVAARSFRKGSGSWFDDFSAVMDGLCDSVSGAELVLGITAQGGSFVFTDEHFHPVGPFVSWTEPAGEEYREKLETFFGIEPFYHKTGWPPAGWLALCKIRKELDLTAGLKSNFRYTATVPDFIHARLCGRFITDITSAQITGLCDFQQADYSEEVLNWAGLSRDHLADIQTSPGVLAEAVTTRWGKLTLTASSHDQYAAMEAAGLVPEKDIMLATGTAWVINFRSSLFFDDHSFAIHPGRDLHPDRFGHIITLGLIGKGFDKLLCRRNLSYEHLAEIEKRISCMPPNVEPLVSGQWLNAPEGETGTAQAVRDYMMYAGALVAYYCEKLEVSKEAGRIRMTGGAAKSGLWPKIIAEVTGLEVEIIDFFELTAFGAAKYAQGSAGIDPAAALPPSAVRTVAAPTDESIRRWFFNEQIHRIEEAGGIGYE